jgi:hypothetical protein
MWDMNRARLTDTTKIVPQKIDNHKIFSLILFTRERERERERERGQFIEKRKIEQFLHSKCIYSVQYDLHGQGISKVN